MPDVTFDNQVIEARVIDARLVEFRAIPAAVVARCAFCRLDASHRLTCDAESDYVCKGHARHAAIVLVGKL